jgi:tetratricopeptide (TPR) repeat protein
MMITLHCGQNSGTVSRMAALRPVLLILLSSITSGMAAEPPATQTSSSPQDFDALAKHITREVTALGYSDKVAQGFVEMVRDWDIAAVRQKLVQAREDRRSGKLSKDQVAQVEKDAAETLSRKIHNEFGSSWDNCDVADVIKDRRANCLGVSQLFFVLGNSLELPVKVVVVSEPARGHYPSERRHAACLVDLTDGGTIMVDATGFGSFWAMLLGDNLVSPPFVFAETFAKTGGHYEIKNETNPLGLHRRIEVLDQSGLLVRVYLNRGHAADQKGDHDRALTHYTEAVRLNPKDAMVYSARGFAYAFKGDLDKAIADYTEAIRLDPKDAQAYLGRGVA